jgi:hypothetical protein
VKVNQRFWRTCRLYLHCRRVTMKTEKICSSETSADFHRTTRRYTSEDRNLHSHRCENKTKVIPGDRSRRSMRRRAARGSCPLEWGASTWSRPTLAGTAGRRLQSEKIGIGHSMIFSSSGSTASTRFPRCQLSHAFISYSARRSFITDGNILLTEVTNWANVWNFDEVYRLYGQNTTQSLMYFGCSGLL